MKLYTEEQVRTMLDLSKLNVYGTKIYSKDELIQQQKPIELPSDEEIREEGLLNFPNSEYVDRSNDRLAYYVGAKWMKKQILNQNK